MHRKLLALTGLVLAVAIGFFAAFLMPKAGLRIEDRQAGTPAASVVNAADAQTVATGRFEKLSSAPNIAGIVVSDPNGDVDLGRYKGKALLINIWATWCPPCVAEMPSLDHLQTKLGGDRFAVVTIAVDEQNMASVQEFLANHQLQNLPPLLDINHAIDQRVRLRSLPASLLVSADGLILARFTGGNKWDCGKPLAAIEGFIKSGDIPADELDPCAD